MGAPTAEIVLGLLCVSCVLCYTNCCIRSRRDVTEYLEEKNQREETGISPTKMQFEQSQKVWIRQRMRLAKDKEKTRLSSDDDRNQLPLSKQEQCHFVGIENWFSSSTNWLDWVMVTDKTCTAYSGCLQLMQCGYTFVESITTQIWNHFTDFGLNLPENQMREIQLCAYVFGSVLVIWLAVFAGFLITGNPIGLDEEALYKRITDKLDLKISISSTKNLTRTDECAIKSSCCKSSMELDVDRTTNETMLSGSGINSGVYDGETANRIISNPAITQTYNQDGKGTDATGQDQSKTGLADSEDKRTKESDIAAWLNNITTIACLGLDVGDGRLVNDFSQDIIENNIEGVPPDAWVHEVLEPSKQLILREDTETSKGPRKQKAQKHVKWKLDGDNNGTPLRFQRGDSEHKDEVCGDETNSEKYQFHDGLPKNGTVLKAEKATPNLDDGLTTKNTESLLQVKGTKCNSFEGFTRNDNCLTRKNHATSSSLDNRFSKIGVVSFQKDKTSSSFDGEFIRDGAEKCHQKKELAAGATDICATEMDRNTCDTRSTDEQVDETVQASAFWSEEARIKCRDWFRNKVIRFPGTHGIRESIAFNQVQWTGEAVDGKGDCQKIKVDDGCCKDKNRMKVASAADTDREHVHWSSGNTSTETQL